MKKQHKYLSVLLIRIGSVLLFYFVSRILFLVFNADMLLQSAVSQSWIYWVKLFVGGGRFDLVSTLTINLPFIILLLLPFPFRTYPLYQKLVKIVLFYIPNIIAFAFDYIDIIYSRFTQKRMTFDVFRFIDAGDGFFGLIPQFIIDFWYIFLIFITVVAIFIFVNQKIEIETKPNNQKLSARDFLKNSLIFVFTIPLCIVFMRGGFQLRPISIVTASHYAIPQHYSLVLNTPFTLIKTVTKSGLDRKSYFNDEKLDEVYQPLFIPNASEDFKPDNVVIIVLEGFSLEYSKELNPKLCQSYTPTLDSIGRMGIMMPAYANGTRSMEGIPAVLAGIPTLMNNEYLTSNYSENQITALPLLLKKYGYTSAFFHGGKNGTMNFNAFTKLAGFDYYYGKDEYGNNADYDGFWGIYDDKFLSYSVEQLDTLTQPFIASIFTLSSHHPYSLPKQYSECFKIKENPGMLESVVYADWALNAFFEKCSKGDWFNNTLFILIADHASQPREKISEKHSGGYSIPFVLYHPNNSFPEIQKSFIQQLDVLPTVLDFLNYQDSAFAFGKSVFDTTPPFAVNYLNNTYQLTTEDYVLMFDGNNVTALYNHKEDVAQRYNLIGEIVIPEHELNILKAIIQTYNNSLIDNTLTINRYRDKKKQE